MLLELETLRPYVGEYKSSAGLSVGIGLDDGQLIWQQPGQVRIPMDPVSETEFVLRNIKAEITFLFEDGKVASLVLLQGGVRYTASKID